SQRPETGVADILHKIHSAEADLQSAVKIDQMTAQRFVEEVAAIRKSPEAARKWVVPVPHAHGFCSKRGSDEFCMDATWLPCRLVRPVKARGVRSPGRPGGGAAVRGALGSAPAGGARNAFQPRGAGGKSADLLRGVPQHTPLSSVLHQYRDAEVSWAHDKAVRKVDVHATAKRRIRVVQLSPAQWTAAAQLRRDSEDSKRRALKAEADLRKLSRLAESRSLDIKALRTALRNRDVQLEASADRIKELEGLLIRSQEDGAIRAATLSAERDDCKALLLATLQRLEAVDEVVHRADMSSAMMQDKASGSSDAPALCAMPELPQMKSLEDERLRALEAAARARAEVADLTESRRKLQWQSKLLEKMSEVQLKHNQRKSEAIKKLLAADPSGNVDALSMLSADSDYPPAAVGQAHGSRSGTAGFRELQQILSDAAYLDRDLAGRRMGSLIAGQEFQHILRLLNTNVDGRVKIMYALTAIKGIGRRFSNIVCKKAEVDMKKRAGECSAEELERLMTIVANPANYKIPTWFLNRQKDYKTGRFTQAGQLVVSTVYARLTSGAIDSVMRDDLERLKKIRNHRWDGSCWMRCSHSAHVGVTCCARGLRTYWGLRVRGQHTKTTGRAGKTMAAKKK
ncbi:hypothetical protein QJQ45_016626, partial [Haematococcus lacustris]